MATIIENNGDASADTGTNYTIVLGDVFQGTLDPAADKDWVKVELTVGTIYDFTLTGVDSAEFDTLRFVWKSYCLWWCRSFRRKAHLQSDCYRHLLYPRWQYG